MTGCFVASEEPAALSSNEPVHRMRRSRGFPRFRRKASTIVDHQFGLTCAAHTEHVERGHDSKESVGTIAKPASVDTGSRVFHTMWTTGSRQARKHLGRAGRVQLVTDR